MAIELSELKLKLGDIIKIESTKQDYHLKYFFIEYIDDELIKIVNIDDGSKDSFELDADGCLTDTTINKIYLLSRSDKDGYARQNGLVMDTYIKLIFDDDIEITGKIVNLEEDMIEIENMGDEEHIFIDFEYKGIPKTIPLKQIVVVEQPTVQEVIEKKIKKTEKEKENEAEKLPESSIKYSPEGDIIISISEDAKIDSVSSTDDYMIGKKVDFFADVEVAESEQRYGIDIQTNDLLDELLSTIPDNQRTSVVMERIYRIIRRFKELRENFSIFDKNGNVTGFKNFNATYKPLVEHLNHLDTNLRWILPVVKQKVKIYSEKIMNDDKGIIGSDLNTELKYYTDLTDLYKENNNYSAFYNGINNIFTPFEKYENDNSILKSDTVKTDLEAIVDNLENYYTYVYKKGDQIAKKKFVIQRYNLGLTKMSNKVMRSGKSVYVRESIGKADTVSIKSVVLLPKPVIEFSRVSLPGSNILTRANLSQLWLFHFKMLTKKIDFAKINIDNVNGEYAYENEEDASPFLDKALSFNISNSIHADYNTILETVIPRSVAIIRLLKSEYIGYNFYDMLAFFEPFLIYADNLTYAGSTKDGKNNELYQGKGGPYQELRTHIIANVKDYNKRYFEQGKKHELLKRIKSADHKMNGMLEHFKLELQNEIKKEYGIKYENASTTEILNKIIELDSGNYYMSLCSFIMSSLYTPDLEKLLESSEYGKDSFSNAKSCLTHVIAKKYTSLDSLQKDNGREEVYFDKEFDTTPYKLLKDYKESQNKMSPKDFLDYFTTVLEMEHGMQSAESVAKSIIAGKKPLDENNYAVLIIYPTLKSAFELSNEEKESVEIEADVKKRVSYFKRKGNNWVRDTEMTDAELTNEMFCNSEKNCFYDKNSEICDIVENAATKMKRIAKKTLFETAAEITLEDFRQKIQNLYELKARQIKKIRLMKEAVAEDYSLRAYHLGNRVILTDIVGSPYAEIRDKILAHVEFVQKHEMIVKFKNNYCRNAIEGESTHWLYCKETNVKLLPTFLYLLASSPIDLYEDVLDRIISENGKISDDGDSIVDKHSGYVICYRDFVTQDEFDDQGFLLKSRDIIEKNEDEEIEKMIDAEIEGNQVNLTKLDKQKTRAFTNLTDQHIYNVSMAVAKSIGINIDKNSNIILYIASKIITNSLLTKERFDEKKEENKKLTYDFYKNNHVFYVTVSVLFIVIQTNLPSFQPNKTYPGCIFSLSGFPLDNTSSDNAGLKYLSCILEKMKSTVSEPWKSVSRFKSDQHLSRIEEKIKKNVLKDLQIQRLLELKRNYLLLHPENIHNNKHDVERKWLLFQPPLIKSAVEKTVSGVAKAIDNEIKETIRTGHFLQHQHIGSVYKKIIEHTYSVVDNINEIVFKEGKEAMLKAGNIVFLENSCCYESIVEKPIVYFGEKDENIKKSIDFVQKYGELYNDIKSLTIPSFACSKLKKNKLVLLDSNNFSDELIYSAYIYYCKLKTNLPVPDDLLDICQEKIVGLNTMSLDESMKVLNDNGKKQTKETLTTLMSKIFIRNQVNISYSDEDAVSFDDLVIHDNVFDIIKEGLETKNFDALNIFLDNFNERFQEEIFSYLTRYGGLTDTEIKKKDRRYVGTIVDFIENVASWTDLKKIPRFIKNTIHNATKVIPSMLVNDGMKNTDMSKTKKYWNFAPTHYENLTTYIDNYFEEILSYDRDQNVCSLFQDICNDDELNSINLFVSEFVTIAHNLDEKIIIKIYKYCYLSIFSKIISESDSKDIELLTIEVPTEEGIEVKIQDKQQFCQQVSRLIVILFNTDINNKKSTNFSYSDLSERFHKDSLAEKKKITDKLKKMSKSDRNVENTMKKYKLGEWFVDDSVYKYDKSKYEEDVSKGATEEPNEENEGFVLEEGDQDRNNNEEN
jgi:hypothetical protein